MKKHTRINSIILVNFITILLTFLLSKYCIQFALIQGDSMLPTYHNWQLVIVNKLDTRYNYGDVIIFTNQNLHSTLVKRIVALPGDTILIQNGSLYVNNIPSSIQPANHKIIYSGIASAPITLSDDEFFVLGDNYNVSKDSRYSSIGCIKKSAIIGKVIFPHDS